MKIGKMFTAAATLAGVVYVKSTRNKKIAIGFFRFFSIIGMHMQA